MAFHFSNLLIWFISFLITTAQPGNLRTVNIPSVSLAVKSPYLSVWLPAGSNPKVNNNGGSLVGSWPRFWTGAIIGCVGYVRVDDEPYMWMGKPDYPKNIKNATQTSFRYTSTRSIFEFDVDGKVKLTVTWMSPVFPTDERLQSASLSYLFVDVESTDGKQHRITVYADTAGEWASGNRGNAIQWEYHGDRQIQAGTGTGTSDSDPVAALNQDGTIVAHGGDNGNIQLTEAGSPAGKIAYHTFWKSNQSEFKEINQQAEWGQWYWSTTPSNGLTFQSGVDGDVRTDWVKNGRLPNTEDRQFRAINDQFVVFAFSHELGNVGRQAVRTEFTMSLFQDRVIKFASAPGQNDSVPGLWKSYWSTPIDCITEFTTRRADIEKLATELDDKVVADSTAVGGNDYASLTTLVVRQAYASLQFAGTSDTKFLFMKEISSDGDIQTVDVIFPLMPIILHFNPRWLKYMLEPLFISQEKDVTPDTPYAIHDLGIYPNAVAYRNASKIEKQPLEECGNMIIMSLVYAQRTGDTEFLTQHYEILKQWAGYLIDESLYPARQISTDDFLGPLINQTNLAVKGIIGLEAMSHISKLTGHSDDAKHYSATAKTYITKWQDLAINRAATPPHTTLNYGNESSYGLLYNIYVDALLNTRIVPAEIYKMQSDFYPTKRLTYGIPLDSRHRAVKSDWSLWTAAVTDTETRELFIGDLARWVRETITMVPTTDLYDAVNSDVVQSAIFQARPVVGGWFALLALNRTGIPTE